MQDIRAKLENYTAAKAEIALIDLELHRHRIVTDSVKGSMTEYPYTLHNIPIQGIELSVAGMLREKRAKLATLRREVEKFLAGVEDSHIACIIRLRYVDGLAWEEVADRLGEGYTAASLKMAMQRYWKKRYTCYPEG